MATTTIPTVSTVPQAGKRGVDVRETFVAKQEAFQDALTDTFIDEFNTSIGSMNTLGGEVETLSSQAESAKNSAEDARDLAQLSEDSAASSANNLGSWASLTGSVSIPASVNHNNQIWVLNTDLADITLSEPSTSNTDWTLATRNFVTTTAKTANYTASVFERVPVDTTGGAFTITLPASPSEGDSIAFYDVGGALSTNNLTLSRNGETIMGLAEDLEAIDKNYISLEIVYLDGDWRIL